MDYTKLLFAVEVRKLTLSRVHDSAPEGLEGEEKGKYIRDAFKKELPATVREFEAVADMIDQARQANAQ